MKRADTDRLFGDFSMAMRKSAMMVNMGNFGDVLMSRPAGREAFLMAKAYVFKGISADDEIILDFDEIKMLAPSWADEFITGIKSEYANVLSYVNTENPSVKATLRFCDSCAM